jgi:predicted negative regulator of RcsB-dependent stress response
MHSERSVSRQPRHRQKGVEGGKFKSSRLCGSRSLPNRGRIISFQALVHIVLAILGFVFLDLAAPCVKADPPTVVESLPNSALDQTDSFMGMRVGDHVRLKCTEPEIELNNAKLLVITKTTVVVSSATGERFTLPKVATTFEAPVNWKRTMTVYDDQTNHSSHHAGGWFLLLFILVAAGAGAGWFWFVRRQESESQTGSRGLTGIKIATTSAKAGNSSGKFKLSPISAQADLAAAPASAARAGLESDSVEDLIETRRYGTAIEHLEQQIKTAPDDFRLRMQLLKVYVIVSNRKQIDRVMHQIEFHPNFSAEQKREANLVVASSKEKEPTAVHAPATQSGTSPVTTAQPAPSQIETSQLSPAPTAPPTPPAPAQPTEAQIRAAEMKAAQARIAQEAIAEAVAAHAAAMKAKAAPASAAAPDSAPVKPVEAPVAKPATTETAVNQAETPAVESASSKPARRSGSSSRKSTKSRQKNAA